MVIKKKQDNNPAFSVYIQHDDRIKQGKPVQQIPVTKRLDLLKYQLQIVCNWMQERIHLIKGEVRWINAVLKHC
jgi:hypothetical protein